MRVREGKGYLLRTGEDTPYAGWVGVRQLDLGSAIPAAPWEALRNLADLARLLPGGLNLLWNAPAAWITQLAPEVRAGFWKGLGHLPGLTLHLRDEAFGPLLQEPISAWLHATRPPSGPLGLAWRQGWLGWAPDPGDGPWSLPGLGLAPCGPEPGADLLDGYLWGELLLPLGALEHLEASELIGALAEAQARAEQAMSQRIGAEAWPVVFPFQRRRTGWRVALLGGREFQLSGGSWSRAATLAEQLTGQLSQALRCPIHLGVSSDPVAAAALGQQAMGEGLPWRNALPLPPASPAFTPGLGADFRDPVPLEARCAFPEPMAEALGALPGMLLRLPAVPMEGAVAAFLSGLRHIPAIRWLPAELPPPGPFLPEHPWAPAKAFPALADTTQVLQPSLFDGLDEVAT